MLIDINFRPPNGLMSAILDVISGDRTKEHIGTGLYLVGHWNFDLLIGEPHEDYPEIPGDLPSVGVCDSPEQWMKAYEQIVNDQNRRFVVSFVKMEKAKQSSDGGWRWRKWGKYIGEQEPQCEYLYDEPKIETIYTFHIYEILPKL